MTAGFIWAAVAYFALAGVIVVALLLDKRPAPPRDLSGEG